MYSIPSKAACLTLIGKLKISVAQLEELIIEDCFIHSIVHSNWPNSKLIYLYHDWKAYMNNIILTIQYKKFTTKVIV